jgi:hypothetical protein
MVEKSVIEVNAILLSFSAFEERTSTKGSDLPTVLTFSVVYWSYCIYNKMSPALVAQFGRAPTI